MFFAGISAAAECPGTADSVTGADVDLVDEGISSPRSDTATAPSCNELKTNNTDPSSSSAATLMDCTQTDDKTSDPQGSPLTHDKQGSADSVQSAAAASAPVTSGRAAGSSQSVVVDGGTLATSDDGLEDLLQGITVDEMSELITLALDDDQTLTQSNTPSDTQNSNSEKVDDQLSEVNSHIYVQSLR